MDPTNFISDFLEYTGGTECPKPFVMWTAYGLLSVASAHKIYLDIGLDDQLVRTDTYILLVGESGHSRKTSTLRFGISVLMDALPETVFGADNETYQGVISTLNKEENKRKYVDENSKEVTYSPYHIFAGELMDYLQLNPVAMVTFLTAIYGQKGYKYRLKNSDSYIPNTFITMCACTTPEWLTAQIQGKQFSEGYGRRTLIICCKDVIRIKPFFTEAAKQAKIRCITRLQRVSTLVGRAQLTPEADSFFWTWYTKLPIPDDRFLRNWYGSLHINVLKIAILNSLAERNDLIVTIDHVEFAIKLLKEVEAQMPMITLLIGRSEVVAPSAELLRIVSNHGGKISEKELRIKTLKDFKDPMEQLRTLQFLQSTGQLVVADFQENGVKKRYVILPNHDKNTT